VSTSEAVRRSNRNMWVAVAALLAICGVVASVLAAAAVGRNDGDKSLRAFQRSSAGINSTLQLAIQHESDLVINAGAYMVSNPTSTQAEFATWTAQVKVLQRYPELVTLAKIDFVSAADLPGYLARADAASSTAANPAASSFKVAPPGARPFYCFIDVTVGAPGAQPPRGSDLCGVPPGAPLVATRDSGQSSLTLFSKGSQNWLGVLTPLYSGGLTPATVQARQKTSIGWVTVLFNPSVPLNEALQGNPGIAASMRYHVGFADVTFTSGPAPSGAQSMTTDLHNGWTVQTAAIVDRGGIGSGNALMLLIGGIALSVALAVLMLVLGTGRSRALRLVQERTEQLRGAQAQLVDTARQAGMAEIATNVLHNVGNVLNSVNISAGLARQKVRASKSAGLVNVVALMHEHADDLGDFLTNDARGKALPGYLDKLATALAGERDSIDHELQRLSKGVDHIKEIVAAQQSLAGVSGVIEPVRVSDLIDDALRMAGILDDDHITILRDIPEDPVVLLDKHRVLLILLNLISNATHAMKGNGARPRQLSVSSRLSPGHEVKITVSDSGEGIPPENLTQIFVHGFTTHVDGHGFGLHSSAIAAREMGGALTVENTDTGTGAAFTLQIPLERELVGV
jgi:signal transduction histidine kinase